MYCKLIGSPGRELPLGLLQPLRGNSLAGPFQVLPREHPGMFRAADADDPLQVRELRAVEFAGAGSVQFRTDLPQQIEIGIRAVPLDERQPADFRLRQRVFEFRGPVGRVDGHQDHADAGRGELQQHPLRPVRGPYAEVVSAPQSDCQQSAGNAIDGPVELGPRQADARLREDHGVAVGKPPRRLPQRRPDGQTIDPRLALPDSRASEEACQPAATKVAEKQFGKYFAFPGQSRAPPAAEPFLDRPTESPAAAGHAAREAPAASMPPARASAARVPPDRRVASEGSAFAAERRSPSSRAATNCSTPSFHRSRRPDSVEQSHRQSLPRGDLSAGQKHRQRRLQPHQFRQSLRASPGRQQAQLDFRQAESRGIIIASDPVAAGQRELQSAPQAWPMDGGDRRHAEVLPARSNSLWPTITICSAL